MSLYSADYNFKYIFNNFSWITFHKLVVVKLENTFIWLVLFFSNSANYLFFVLIFYISFPV